MQHKNRLPNLIIAGVVKAGTTSIYSYLSQHPEICCSSIKETCYFLSFRYHSEVKPFEVYQKYFSHCGCQKYVMEATPGYFEGGYRVATEIKKQVGDLKIIIVLRNPIDRLFSFFKYKKSILDLDKNINFDKYLKICEQLSFEEISKQENDRYWGIEGGFYAKYIEQWFEVFGESIKIIFFDDLKVNPIKVLEDLSCWLEIDAAIYQSANLTVENKTVNYKNEFFQKIALYINEQGEKFWRSNPKIKINLRNFYYSLNSRPHDDQISEQTFLYLKSIYKPYNQKLRSQLISHGYTALPPWLNEDSLSV